MDSTDLGPLYEEVGRYLAEDVRSGADGAYLYAEVLPGVVDCSIFKDLGNRVIYRECSLELSDKLYEIWEKLDKSDRWSGIHYTIVGNRFETSFDFADSFKPGESIIDRRPRITTAKFGDKPIDFSDP